MAVEECGTTSQNGQRGGKITVYVVLSCMMAAMGGVLYGYDTGISGGVTSMDSFLEEFFPEVYEKEQEVTESNYCRFDSQLLTAFTSSLYVAGLVTSFVASHVTGTHGRKPSIIAGGLAFFVGSALCGGAVNIYMLIVGRLFLGVGVGFANQAVPLYLSEMAPAKFRGAISNGFQFSISTGVLVASLINYGTENISGGWGWRISLGLAVVPATILTLGTLFLPETPNSILQSKQDEKKAKQILQRIRGTDDVQAELDDLIEASTTAKMTKKPFKMIFKRQYRPQLVMAIAIPFFQQVTGVNAFSFYAPLLFRTVGFGESASLMSSVLMGLVGISAVFISMLLVDRVGRRTLFIIGGVQMFVSQCVVGSIMAAELKDEGEMSTGYAYLVLAFILIYTTGFAWSWGPLGWLVPSEIFPLEIRSTGQSLNVAMSFFITSIVTQTFLALLCEFKSRIFFFFGGWVVVMTVFVYYFLPETKNVPIEQMKKVWQEHWFWKRFVSKQGSSSVHEKLLV